MGRHEGYGHIVHENHILRDIHFRVENRVRGGAVSQTQFGQWETLMRRYAAIISNPVLQEKPKQAASVQPQGFQQQWQNFFAMQQAMQPLPATPEQNAEKLSRDINGFLDALQGVAAFDPVNAAGIAGLAEAYLYMAPEFLGMGSALLEVRGARDVLLAEAAGRVGGLRPEDVDGFFEMAFNAANAGLAVHPHANRNAVEAMEKAAASGCRPSDSFRSAALHELMRREGTGLKRSSRPESAMMLEIRSLNARMKRCLESFPAP